MVARQCETPLQPEGRVGSRQEGESECPSVPNFGWTGHWLLEENQQPSQTKGEEKSVKEEQSAHPALESEILVLR